MHEGMKYSTRHKGVDWAGHVPGMSRCDMNSRVVEIFRKKLQLTILGQVAKQFAAWHQDKLVEFCMTFRKPFNSSGHHAADGARLRNDWCQITLLWTLPVSWPKYTFSRTRSYPNEQLLLCFRFIPQKQKKKNAIRLRVETRLKTIYLRKRNTDVTTLI
jgi:hypothetical protein